VSDSNVVKLGTERATRGLKNLESALLGSLQQAVIATDPDGNVIYWNRAAEQLYGWSFSEVAGRTIVDETPTAASKEQAAEIMEKLKRGESWSGEFPVRDKQGRWFAARVTDCPVYDETGNLAAIVGTSTDASVQVSRNGTDGKSRIKQFLRTPSQAVRGVTASASAPGLLTGFGIAAVLFLAALGSRVLLDNIAPGRLPFFTFFPAVLLGAFLCGPWPTLALLLAASITGAIWSTPSIGDPRLAFRSSAAPSSGRSWSRSWSPCLRMHRGSILQDHQWSCPATQPSPSD
jgi:PAS domain S-box-containing protein